MDPQIIDPFLVRHKNLSFEDNLYELEKIIKLYKKKVPDIKLILSVSPIHLNRTYSKNNHIVAASCYSKSVIRAAIGEFVKRYPDCVYYFPSYETIIYGEKEVWEKDLRHVSSKGVQ